MEVLHALDIQHGHPAAAVQRVAIGDQAAGDTGNRCLDGYTSIHQGQGGSANRSLRGGAVGAHDFRNGTDGVRELFHAGQHGDQSTLRQVAVADLAAAGAAGCAGFAGGVRRHVIVMDVALERGVGQVVHHLGIFGGAQGADGQGLGLAAGEQAGAVHTGQHTDFGGQRADLIDAAAVNTLAFFQQPGAHNLLLQLIADQIQVGGVQFGVFLGNSIHDGQHGGIADVFVVGVHGSLDIFQVLGVHIRQQSVVQFHRGKALLRLADLCNNAVHKGEQLFDFLMASLDGVHHDLFGHFVGAGFNHDDLFHAGSQGQGQVRALALLLGGVQHDLAVHIADCHAADGAIPGDIRHGNGERRAVHTGNLRGAVRVKAHHSHGHADIVAHILGEQRADGAVNHAGGQDGVFTGAAFAAHKGAGNAAGGVQLFFKFHAQGEEIHPFTRLFAHGNIAQHAGFAIADHCAAIGKAAELAGFHHKRAAGKSCFKLVVVGESCLTGCKFQCHSNSPSDIIFDTWWEYAVQAAPCFEQ